MPAIPYTKTAVDVDGSFDGPKEIAELPNSVTADELRQLFAWVDPSGDPDTKAAYKFPHHDVIDGKVGAANYHACVNAIAVLNGARGGANIPEADVKGVYNHVAGHIKDGDKTPPALNSVEKIKHSVGIHVETNAFVDRGNGLIQFPNGQVITDNTLQRNGTRYNIPTMDTSEYNGQLTADHVDSLQTLIGKVQGMAKTDDAVTINGIQFAVQDSDAAVLAYNLMKNGFLTDLSIETFGPPPDDQGVYYNSALVGLSAVVVGNNRSAHIAQVMHNSIAEAREHGLDTSRAEKLESELFPEPTPPSEPDHKPVEQPTPQKPTEDEPLTNQENDMKYVTIANSRDFALAVKYKNAAGAEVELELAPNATVDVAEDQKDAVEAQINGATAPQPDLAEMVKNTLAEALKPLQDKLDKVEQQAFDKGAQEPEFHITDNSASSTTGTGENAPKHLMHLKGMDWRERHGKQINFAWDAIKNADYEASKNLRAINEYNLSVLKEKGLVVNSLTIGNFGNFVISPELLSQIQGVRTNYKPLVDATQWQETLSTQMAWLERSGDINMQPVDYLDATPNSNLKPLSTYSANIQTSVLEELAAVTPVVNSATRFLAADLLGDVATGYANDYDRKRAQLVVARLEQAVDNNPAHSIAYNVPNNSTGVTDFLDVWTAIGNTTPNGTYVLGTSSFSELMKRAFAAGANGPLSQIFTQRDGDVPMIFNRPYIVVSDDLLPRLNTNDSVSFTIDGVAVTITHSVFYADLTNFTGRTSNGLQYDLSTEAAYEDSGVVKSAFQRNELVLRGSFFRGGAIKDPTQVSALLSPGLS